MSPLAPGGCAGSAAGRYGRTVGGRRLSVYFGDLHGHTSYSVDALAFILNFDPDEYYRYARDEALLDFAAITDHDAPMGLYEHASKWEAVLELNRKYHEPGKFVTFNAYEWTSGDGLTTLNEYQAGRKWENYERDLVENALWGHRNVYFPGDDLPQRVFSCDAPESDTPEKLWACMRPYGAIAIPHHPLGGPVPPFKWNAYDPELEPIVEIDSYHGSSETDVGPLPIYNPYDNGMHNVRHALSLGHRFGLIGSTDNHMGRGGWMGNDKMIDWLVESYGGEPARGGGLACLYSEDLTREKLWEALVQRRTYATTGGKIVLDFSIGETFMGGEAEMDARPLLKIRVIGTAALSKIEIIRSGDVIHTFRSPVWDSTREFEDETLQPGSVWYIVRVTQQDGEMAWSSPIWVTYRG